MYGVTLIYHYSVQPAALAEDLFLIRTVEVFQPCLFSLALKCTEYARSCKDSGEQDRLFLGPWPRSLSIYRGLGDSY